VLAEGSDVTIIACGPLVYEALQAAEQLKKHHLSVEVINCATIKPLDAKTIVASAKKTGRVVTVEEAQMAGGLGGAVTELLSEQFPVPVFRVGSNDRYGQSGEVAQLWQEYDMNAIAIAKVVMKISVRGKK
jgi:transketolase